MRLAVHKGLLDRLARQPFVMGQDNKKGIGRGVMAGKGERSVWSRRFLRIISISIGHIVAFQQHLLIFLLC